MINKTSIIIADDHPIFRAGLKQTIETNSRYEIVAEASDGAAALALALRHTPEIIILDINMPQLNGFEVVTELRREKSAVRIVFLTMHSERQMFAKAMDAGVNGYVLKDSAASDIINCLNAVAAGENFASPAITSYLFQRLSETAKNETLADLTVTERKILQKIAEYKTSKEIADELFLSYRTIENYRTNICSKLDLRGSHSLIKYAVQNKDRL